MKSSPRFKILIFFLTLCLLVLGGFLYYRFFYLTSFGTIAITTMPQGAVVLVDGEEQGETPVEVRVRKGEYTVRIQKEGYVTVHEPFDIQAGAYELRGFALEREGDN